jgi:hypothetical protein
MFQISHVVTPIIYCGYRIKHSYDGWQQSIITSHPCRLNGNIMRYQNLRIDEIYNFNQLTELNSIANNDGDYIYG